MVITFLKKNISFCVYIFKTKNFSNLYDRADVHTLGVEQLSYEKQIKYNLKQ